ncbi:MAG TPA: hydroxysqualene dehydroxylase HpnE [Dehalococcoidia bacterium]|nr:hydroxysqualene dehydroxylase HpnE [Dehalococcoidia bacterium]
MADLGHRVLVLERRPWAGGKTYSFVDRGSGAEIDNGQHILMRCTTAYVEFLRRLGTLHLTRMQERLSVPVLDATGRLSVLAASPLPAPLHLLPSFATYAHLPLRERARVARAVTAIARMPAGQRDRFAGETFAGWLRARGLSDFVIREFWDLIVVPTLNCRSDRASAAQALFVFQEGLLASPASAAIGLPLAPLSELHGMPAVRYIESRGGEVRLRAGVESLVISGGRVAGLRLSGGAEERFHACVIALPPAQALDIVPPLMRGESPFRDMTTFETSPIINLHLWFDGPVMDHEFVAFTGCELQWAFSRTRIAGRGDGAPDHIVLSLSAADEILDLEKHELVARLLPQLRRALPKARSRTLLRAVVIKEPDATFVPSPGLRRPANTTHLPNLMVAGAYTGTGWPATMESAVRSGISAARALDDRAAMVEGAARGMTAEAVVA